VHCEEKICETPVYEIQLGQVQADTCGKEMGFWLLKDDPHVIELCSVDPWCHPWAKGRNEQESIHDHTKLKQYFKGEET
jgi:hypothetical protein